jgi:hypothetical protein
MLFKIYYFVIFIFNVLFTVITKYEDDQHNCINSII